MVLSRRRLLGTLVLATFVCGTYAVARGLGADASLAMLLALLCVVGNMVYVVVCRSPMKDTADAIGELVALFLPHCADKSTLFELKRMTSRSKKWREAHKLFSRIRTKTLQADQTNNRRLQIQYSFEELCAKTLYNIADHSAGFSSEYLPPFDEDSPLYVVPAAIALSKELGIDGFSFDSVKARIDVAGQR